MRRILLVSFVMCVMCAFGTAQTVVFSDNFDSYAAGSHLAQSNPAWTTWNNLPGSSEDGLISNAQAFSTPNSLHVTNSVDQVYRFDDYSNGHYSISFNMYVSTNDNGAYFNIQKAKNTWAFGCYFYNDGTGYFKVGGDSTFFNYPSTTWFPVTVDINLNENLGSISINNTVVDTWPFGYYENFESSNGLVALSAIDFYASGPGNMTGEYYVDDFTVTEIIPFENKIPISPDTLWLTMTPDDTSSVVLTIYNPVHRGGTYEISIAYDVPEPDMTSTGEEEMKWHNMNDTDTTLTELCGSTQHDFAVLFGPTYILDNWIGKTIRNIRVPLTSGATNAKIRIYDVIKDIPHSSFDFIPSDMLYEQAFEPVEGLNDVILNTPFVIDGSGFCIGVWIEHPDTCYMIYSDNGPGTWFSYSKTGEASTWERFSAHNFMISAIIDGTPITPWLDVTSISSVFSPSSSITDTVMVNTNGMNVGEAHSAKIYCYATGYENRRVVPVYLNITNVSINEYNQIEVALYPNPATNLMHITSDQILRVEIYNLMGQRLFDNTYSDSQVVIPTTNLSAGTYLVKVTTNGGTTTKKVVVR